MGILLYGILLNQEVGEAENRGAFAESELILGKECGKPKEFFFASDASAVVEHTKKVMVIEDNEVVHIKVSTDYFLLSNQQNCMSSCGLVKLWELHGNCGIDRVLQGNQLAFSFSCGRLILILVGGRWLLKDCLLLL